MNYMIYATGLQEYGPIEAKQQIGSKSSNLFYANLEASGPLVFLGLSEQLVDVFTAQAEVGAHDGL